MCAGSRGYAANGALFTSRCLLLGMEAASAWISEEMMKEGGLITANVSCVWKPFEVVFDCAIVCVGVGVWVCGEA